MPRGRPGPVTQPGEEEPRDTLPVIATDTLPAVATDTLAAARLAKRQDPNRRRYTLAHQIQYHFNSYKFFDEEPDNTNFPDYYGDFLVDARGLRFFVRQRELENSFRLRSFKPVGRSRNFAQQQRDLIEV